LIDLSLLSTKLTRSPEGDWRSRPARAISYPESGNKFCFDVEDSSFWFAHRNACILEAVNQFPPHGALFDIGGGNGFVSMALQNAGFEVVLVEPGPIGVRNALRRGVRHVVCSTLEEAGFGPESLAAVGLFDVIEHIKDDHAFLHLIREQLAPDGRLYVTVPSYRWLWSREDIDAGHYRRYTRRGLFETISAAGFDVELLTGIFRCLPPGILLLRVLPYRLGVSRPFDPAYTANVRRQHQVGDGISGSVLNRFLSGEIDRIRLRQTMNIGASWLAVARRLPWAKRYRG
jgi:SAM-dependent methyltransferase